MICKRLLKLFVMLSMYLEYYVPLELYFSSDFYGITFEGLILTHIYIYTYKHTHKH